MRRIRIMQEGIARSAKTRDLYAVLPLDARDPAVLRAKALLRDRDRSGATPPHPS
jgi:hypothetical protein